MLSTRWSTRARSESCNPADFYQDFAADLAHDRADFESRAQSQTVELEGASHAVYESRPNEVAAVIEAAAQHALCTNARQRISNSFVRSGLVKAFMQRIQTPRIRVS